MIDSRLHHAFYGWLYQVTTAKSSVAKNIWLEGNYCDVYVRYFMGKIEIANVNVQPEWQQKGIFTNFLTIVEHCGRPIKIENVLNDDLAKHLERRAGYTCKRGSPVDLPSFYWG